MLRKRRRVSYLLRELSKRESKVGGKEHDRRRSSGVRPTQRTVCTATHPGGGKTTRNRHISRLPPSRDHGMRKPPGHREKSSIPSGGHQEYCLVEEPDEIIAPRPGTARSWNVVRRMNRPNCVCGSRNSRQKRATGPTVSTSRELRFPMAHRCAWWLSLCRRGRCCRSNEPERC